VQEQLLLWMGSVDLDAEPAKGGNSGSKTERRKSLNAATLWSTKKNDEERPKTARSKSRIFGRKARTGSIFGSNSPLLSLSSPSMAEESTLKASSSSSTPTKKTKDFLANTSYGGKQSSKKVQNMTFSSLVHCAAQDGDLDMFYNFSSTSNINDLDNGVTALYVACGNGRHEFAKELIKMGAKVNIPRKSNGDTALHAAAKGDHETCVRLLLSKGANPMLRDKSGQSPMDVAASRQIKLLISSAIKRVKQKAAR